MKPAHPASERDRPTAAFGRTAVFLLMAVALGGCYTTHEVAENGGPPAPDDYRLRHPISIHEKERTVVVFVGNNRGGLTPAQRADVLAFAQAWKREASGGVVIEIPSGTPNEHAAADSLHEIQSILSAAGLPPGGVQERTYQENDPGRLAVIRLSYPRMTAEAGPCGLWPEDLGPGKGSYLENRPYYNFGCATQRNLAAMVDNPADLVQPRGETPASGSRRTTVLDKYRQGTATATQYDSENAGKISDVGK
jgi:pilus assembly protein CpaD